ncbi:hypothetical protein ACFZAD_24635 [Streptomyces iakyrus]|uniref:hypothetical protein n=1 Tax=Streptomyces iakyrus TaxID=68219 RepID=UPI0036E426FD
MADRYWIGGSGDWSDTAHWSTTSGGPGGASEPTSTDDVHFEGATKNIQLPSSSAAASIENSGSQVTLTFGSLNDPLEVGDLLVGSSIVFVGGGWVKISGDATLSGSHEAVIEVGPSGYFQLVGDISLWGLGVDGRFEAAGYDITIPSSDWEYFGIGFGSESTGEVDGSLTIQTFGSFFQNLGSVDFSLAEIVIEGPVNLFHSSGSSAFGSLILAGEDLQYDVWGDNTFTTLEIAPGAEVLFDIDSTQTVTNFIATGTSSKPITIRSTEDGTPFILSKASGTVEATYLDIRDSIATGGATWNALLSIDSGNNTGWNIYLAGTLYPTSIPSAEDFGTPTLTLPPVTIAPMSIVSGEAFGSFTTTMYISDAGDIASEEAVGEPTIVQFDPPPAPPPDWTAVGKEDEKEYVYKVYDADGNFVGVWTDVTDSPEFTQQINTPGTTMTVQLARSANTTKEARTALVGQDDDPLTTEDGESLIVVFETPNTVGEDTDVELNYNVDVYVHYGEFEELTTQDGETLTTEDEEALQVAAGAPLGIRIFSGFILDYESVYGEETGVTVTLASHGHELSNELIRDGDTTTVTFSSTEIATGVKDILDTNPGKMSYDASSIDNTGVSPTLKFQLNTKLEGIQTYYEQTPDGWYWYGNVAENNVYIKEASTTADHVFILGKHIKSLRLKRSIESLKNVVYFVGGEVTPGNPATTLFKKYEDVTSQGNWRKGLERITDRRYTLATSAQARSEKAMSRYKDPIYTTPVVISSGRYDIESIKLGQTVGFRNFGNFIDDVVLQIVGLTYSSTAATLELGELQERQIDAVAGLEEGLANEQYETLPTTPS